MEEEKKLKLMANKIRQHIIKMIHSAQSGHPGSSLSCVELLVLLYFHELKHDFKKPNWSERDHFILSKGHACPTQYACLAESNYFSVEELMTFRKINSHLQGHPAAHKTKGIEASTGPLGTGLSIANGIALGKRIDKIDSFTFVLMGDGELQEGMIWEAAMTSGFRKLNKLIAFVDWNDLQIDGKVSEIKEVAPIEKKFEAFGWNTLKCNAPDFNELLNAITEAKKSKEKPTVIVLKSIKGKGVSFMENKCEWHGVAPNDEEAKQALEELKKESDSL
ncbi:MAG: transketolase [Candidatus Diapherotrites archaeon]